MKTGLWFRKLISLGLTLLACGCGARGFGPNPREAGSENSNSPQPPVDSASPTPSSDSSSQTTPPITYDPLLWDTKRKEGSAWTKFSLDLIKSDLANDLLPGTQDIEDFCANYFQMKLDDQVHFWGLLVSAMVKYESNFNPLSRMQESTMGTDSVTGLPVYSEGLLQLSYQDTKWAPYCDFQWNRDKNLSPTDPNKTILNPLKNLNCGIRILARQVQKTKLIAAPAGSNYWAVIVPGGKYTQLSNIQNLTQQQKGCMGP